MLLKNAGVKGQKTVFLITDAQIKDEAFLEDVDSVLNSGEVPNLFAVDEKQEIMEVAVFKALNWSSFLLYKVISSLKKCLVNIKRIPSLLFFL